MNCDQPFKHLSAPLRGAEVGTFTHRSIVQRLPEIGQRTLAENDFSPGVVRKIQRLLSEVPEGPIRHLEDETLDAGPWSDYIEPYEGADWLDPPWFFAEHYFYRRLLEATGYFTSGLSLGVDPFKQQKRQGLETSKEAIVDLCKQVLNLLTRERWSSEGSRRLLSFSLWGNRADLSMWPAGLEEGANQLIGQGSSDHTLVDDSQVVSAVLSRMEGLENRIDLLIDNAGFELVADLILATYLLKVNIARSVTLHTKIHPTYVSDATNADIWEVVNFLYKTGSPEISEISNMIISYLNGGRLVLKPHPFWTSPLPGWEMPLDLRDSLRGSTLIISKGDAHYRRLLGDRHWPYRTPIDQVLCYLPASLLALRTLKSEVAAGIPIGRINQAEQQDPDWLVSGQWGIIQFHKKDA